MNIPQYIEINPKVMMGKPVIRGTHITVDLIQEKLFAGETVQDILTAYPYITQEAIDAVIVYTALETYYALFFDIK